MTTTMPTTTWTPLLNASLIDDYYNVTEPILVILNSTESTSHMEQYWTSENPTTENIVESTSERTTEHYTSTPMTPMTSTPMTTSACYEIMVDCATLNRTQTMTRPTADTSPLSNDVLDVLKRAKRQDVVMSSTPRGLSDDALTTPKGSSPNIAVLLDTLRNSIFRRQRNNTRTRTTRFTTTSALTTDKVQSTTMELAPIQRDSAATSDLQTETTDTPITENLAFSGSERPSEYSRDYTTENWSGASEQTVTTDQDDLMNSSELFSDMITDPLTSSWYAEETVVDFTSASDWVQETSTPTRQLCYVTICPDFNDTLCRGDNPQGCTDYWSGTRNDMTTKQQYTAPPTGN